MHPRSYRKQAKLTLSDMAELVGASNASVVSKHERAIMFPSPERIERYRKASAGAVTHEDFYVLHQQAKRNRARNSPDPKGE